MADADTRLPVRALATDVTVEVADSTGTTINPAEEFGQGSTTSGQKGPLVQGAVTTAAPTYTTAQTSPISLTTAGAVRTDSSATTQPISASSLPLPTGASTSANQTNGTQKTQVVDGSGNVIGSTSNALDENVKSWLGSTAPTVGQKTSANSLPVVIASDQSSVPVTFSNTTVELPQYNTASAIAANASSTQSYTPGSTVSLDGFDGSSSGQAKWELQYGTTGSETTKVVKFTSKGDLSVSFRFPNPISITSAMTVKLIRTNMDNQALDLYSTIEVH